LGEKNWGVLTTRQVRKGSLKNHEGESQGCGTQEETPKPYGEKGGWYMAEYDETQEQPPKKNKTKKTPLGTKRPPAWKCKAKGDVRKEESEKKGGGTR